ncbi:MAG: metallophosphatase family protein [Chromatiaceae bacterium]|nr:metallophosphatase family protein [Chromatiaceae bacterium]
MKVAVFSDVQGNLPAMEVAVEHILNWKPDLVVMAGDLINRGPSSRACLDLFDPLRHERGWLPILGNHEAWVLRCGRERPLDALDADMRRFADLAFEQIAGVEEALLCWPDHMSFHADAPDSWVHVTHGSMAGNRVGISASVSDADLRDRLPQDVALFVGAHTHKPLQRRHGNTEILNVGSVGSPFDGDVRASYGQLELRGGRWRTRILRLAYDRERTERDFEESGFVEQGGPLARIIFEEWRQARVLLAGWHHRYRDAVRRGDVTLERSVDDYLGSLD